jgi:tetratricopeptide (TPR) repeat protein
VDTTRKPTRPGEAKLGSWKEIAAFFGRDQRTVKRWEASRGLPLHRVPGGGSARVYAYPDELEAWLAEGRADGPARLAADAPSKIEAPGAYSRLLIGAVAGGLVVGLAALALLRTAPSGVLIAPPAAHSQKIDPAVEELYRTGLYYRQTRTALGLATAIDDFTQAIVRDPTYAPAYAGLAGAYSLMPEYTVMTPQDAYPRADAAARRAIALDPALAEAHASLGYVDFYWSRRPGAALREFDTALRLAPGSANAHHWHATVLMTLGRFGESLAEIERAQALDPESPAILADRGLILFHAGRADEAMTLLRQIEESQPGFLSPHTYLAFIHETRGEDAGYVRELTAAAALLSDDRRQAIATAASRGLASGGRKGMLQAILAAQQHLFLDGRASAFQLARAYARLGMVPEALATLQLSADRQEPEDIYLTLDPAFAPLHGQPAFRAIVRRIGLPSPA